MSARRRAATGTIALGIVLMGVPAQAADLDINHLPQVSDEELARTITDLRLPVDDIRVPEPQDITTEATDGPETVLSLSSDILFDFDKATISRGAAARIEDLVEDLPRKAKVGIGGHTDSLGSDARNQTLSTKRANAVAAVIKKARPDLALTVKGYGESTPVASNGSPSQDDPQGRAKNRRVEIRYTD